MFRPLALSFTFALAASLFAADPATPATPAPTPAKPELKITPGKVIIPTDKMQRPWGELISVDLATRTGKFRREGTDEICAFTVMPYAELLHHAANGDLQDFRPGERVIFRLHENEKGEWVWLTYIQDEMNMMLNHKEFFHVTEFDAAKGEIVATQANADKSYVREEGIHIQTDKETHFWKGGVPVKFADLKIGDALRTKTHGVGSGKTRVAWEVFLDEESLLKFSNEQKAVNEARILQFGAPGYVDENAGTSLKLTLFNEGSSQMKLLKPGKAVKVAPAGVDRAANAPAVDAKVVSIKMAGRQGLVALELTTPSTGFKQTELARLWVAE